MASNATQPVVLAGPSQAAQPGGYGQRGAGPSGYGGRPETRSCLICKQIGHLYRFCPNKATAAAALGAAPQ